MQELSGSQQSAALAQWNETYAYPPPGVPLELIACSAAEQRQVDQFDFELLVQH